jgi:hypothetical protein
MEPGRLQITFDCLDPARAGTFWAAALAYPTPDVEGWHNFLRSQGRSEEDLNAGVPAPTVARRAGHSVEVLLRVYANCIDGDEEVANQRISGALG